MQKLWKTCLPAQPCPASSLPASLNIHEVKLGLLLHYVQGGSTLFSILANSSGSTAVLYILEWCDETAANKVLRHSMAPLSVVLVSVMTEIAARSQLGLMHHSWVFHQTQARQYALSCVFLAMFACWIISCTSLSGNGNICTTICHLVSYFSMISSTLLLCSTTLAEEWCTYQQSEMSTFCPSIILLTGFPVTAQQKNNSSGITKIILVKSMDKWWDAMCNSVYHWVLSFWWCPTIYYDNLLMDL